MNVQNKALSRAPQSPSQFAAKPIFAFFGRRYSDLWHAARLLGGYEASRLVDRCAASLEREGAISPRVRTMLEQILAVLSLDRVEDPDRPFMGYFAVIDPSDPVVGEICLLTDELRSAITESAKRLNWAEARKQDDPAA